MIHCDGAKLYFDSNLVTRESIKWIQMGTAYYSGRPDADQSTSFRVVTGERSYRALRSNGELILVDEACKPQFIPYETVSDELFFASVGGTKEQHRRWFHAWEQAEEYRSFIFLPRPKEAKDVPYELSYNATRHMYFNKERVTIAFFRQIDEIHSLPELESLVDVSGPCKYGRLVPFVIFVLQTGETQRLVKIRLKTLIDITRAPDATEDARIFGSVIRYYFPEAQAQAFIGA